MKAGHNQHAQHQQHQQHAPNYLVDFIKDQLKYQIADILEEILPGILKEILKDIIDDILRAILKDILRDILKDLVQESLSPLTEQLSLFSNFSSFYSKSSNGNGKDTSKEDDDDEEDFFTLKRSGAMTRRYALKTLTKQKKLASISDFDDSGRSLDGLDMSHADAFVLKYWKHIPMVMAVCIPLLMVFWKYLPMNREAAAQV